MLELQILRDQRERTLTGLKKRGLDEERLGLVDKIIALDSERKEIQTQLDGYLNERNNLSDEIGNLFRQGKAQEANELKIKVQAVKDIADSLEQKLNGIKTELEANLILLPNIPHVSVPEGRSPEDNKIHKAWEGAMPQLPKDALPHWELIKKYDIIDFELGIKIAGAGFPVYKGKGAKLQRALINFFLDEAEKQGYAEIQPPIVVNEASGVTPSQGPVLLQCEGSEVFFRKVELRPITGR